MQQNPSYGESLGNWYLYFAYCMDESCLLRKTPHMGNPWFSQSTSYSMGKCNSTHLTGRDWYSYFPHSIGNFSPWDSHPMVYFITLEMHRISHQFLIAWEKVGKRIEWQKSGKLITGKILQNSSYVENLRTWYLYFSYNTGDFFSHDISMLWLTSSHRKCMGFLINFWKYNKRKQNPSNRQSLGSWFLHIFNKMGAFFIRFLSCGILHHMENAWVFS